MFSLAQIEQLDALNNSKIMQSMSRGSFVSVTGASNLLASPTSPPPLGMTTTRGSNATSTTQGGGHTQGEILGLTTLEDDIWAAADRDSAVPPEEDEESLGYGFGPPSIVASLLDSPSTTAHNRLLCQEQHESAPPKHSYPTPSDSSEGFGRSLMDSRSDPLITRPSTSACYDEPDCDKIEAEDLEVQWINESFEEQEKHKHLYANDGLKTLFYTGANAEVKPSERRKSCESSSDCVERPDRLPYAKRLSNQESRGSRESKDTPIQVTPAKNIQTVPQHTDNFIPLLTPKSEALLHRKLTEPQLQQPVLPTLQETFSNIKLLQEESDTEDRTEALATDVAEKLLLSTGLTPGSSTTTANLARAYQQQPTFSFSEQLDNATESLAIELIETVLFGTNLTPTTVPQLPERIFEAESRKLEKGKACRRLDMDDLPSSSTSEPKESSRADSGAPEEDDAGGSWEDLDDEAIDKQFQELKILDSKDDPLRKTAKKPINYFDPPPAFPSEQIDFNPNDLMHVLEAYNVPEYKVADDVRKTVVEKMGYDKADVLWIDRKTVLVAFEDERQAKRVSSLTPSHWLKFRPLVQSPAHVKKAAMENRAKLRSKIPRPVTNAATARRLVEAALGKKSSVSKEKRQEEAKQLAEARAFKKNANSAWDD